jgi:hypothetical protein
MGFRKYMNEAKPVKVSLSFFAADIAALTDRVSDVRKAGVKVQRATVLRALVHLTPVDEMVALTVRLAGDYALGNVTPADGPVCDHPTVDFPKHDVEKLDGVISHLAKARIIGTRTFVVRAILRAAPDGRTLAPDVKKFLTDFPNKPRGLSKIRLARRAREHD